MNEFDNQLISTCLDSGAYRAAVIETDRIPFDESLRAYCEANACGSYNKNYACPPCVGSPQEVIHKAKQYKKALVFQTVTELEDSFDLEGMARGQKFHEETAKKIYGAVSGQIAPFLQLTAGGCTICPVCAKAEEKPCPFPQLAVSSLEAYCMNVSTLAPLCGMKYINGANTVTYFGMFLYDFQEAAE